MSAALFAGCDSEAVLLRLDTGYLDDGETYDLLAQSQPVAYGGPGGECAFYLLYLTTQHYDVDVSLRVTPLVDGQPLPTQQLDLAGVPDSTGELQTHEISLTVPYLVGGVEKLRYAQRGTWFALRVEATVAGAVDIDSVELELEIVRETKVAIG